MLQEIPAVRQRGLEPRRRWFTNADFDLYVWQAADEIIVAFQLCYDKNGDERVLFWDEQSGYSHAGIEAGARRGTYAGTPVFRADGTFDAQATLSELMMVRGDMEERIFGFVRQKLLDFRADMPIRQPG
jgi:hypothetical protein